MSSRPPDRLDSSAAWDAAKYDSCGTFVWEHGAGLVETLAPRSGERVLDVGCGTGHLTAKIAATGADVLGIDASGSMVRQARTNYPNLRFEVLDALEMRLEPLFDAVLSNAVLHWITEPYVAASNIFGALRPGGRFVAELGGKGNIRAIIAAVHRARRKIGAPAIERMPWYFPDADEYSTLLGRLGFTVTHARLFSRPTELGEGQGVMTAWLRMFAEPLLADLTEPQRGNVCAIAEDHLQATMLRDGAWVADYVRLRVVAERPLL